MLVSNTKITILSFSTVNLILIDSLDGTLFLLLEVAYTLGFYINLISANRTANADIFLRSKDNLLKEVDSTPIYYLNRRSSVYLIR